MSKTIGGVASVLERLRSEERAACADEANYQAQSFGIAASTIEHQLSAIVELRASLEETLVLAESAFGDIDSAQERLERAELAIEKSKSFVGAKS